MLTCSLWKIPIFCDFYNILNMDGERDVWVDYLCQRASLSPQNNTCLVWQNAKTKNSLYGACKVKLANETHASFIYAHRLSYITANNLSRADISGLCVSHLCGNGLCILPAHLNIEPQSINNQRKTCKTISKGAPIEKRRCIGHHAQPNCMVMLF